jgi:hypothetical protein
MEKIIGKAGASCAEAAKVGACKHDAVAKMCCSSCKNPPKPVCKDASAEVMAAKMERPGANCADAVKIGACKHKVIADMCCESCRSASPPAASCKDTDAAILATKMKIPGASCPDAASKGACKHKAISDMCCESCKPHDGPAPAPSPPIADPSCKDTSAAQMEKMMKKEGASCPHAASVGACKHDEIKKICCESCKGKFAPAAPPAGPPVCIDASAQEMALAFAPGASCPGAAVEGACSKPTVAKMCCQSCKCLDATPEVMAKTFGAGASCPHAAKHGACQKEKTRMMCCASCKGTPPIKGATITDDGTPFNPWSTDGCFDASMKEMEKEFGPHASCGHAAAFGQCNAGTKVKKMCCASCGENWNGAAKHNGGNGEILGTTAPGKFAERTPPPNPADELKDLFKNGAKKVTVPSLPGCQDLPDDAFHKAMHNDVLETHWHAKRYQKTCPHAMMMNLCSDAKIGVHIRKMCCKSCTADDGKSVCADKPAAELSQILGLKKVSCGTVTANAKEDACAHPKIKANCCSSCRKKEIFKTCKDATEAELRKAVGQDGEGGCAHAAAEGKCEKSAVYHQMCCATCELHRDITK